MKTGSNMSGQSITTRKGFVVALGSSVLSLYLLWAAYGAAPLGFGSDHEPRAGGSGPGTITMHNLPGMEHAMPGTKKGRQAMEGMMGHGMGGGGMSVAEFQRRAEAFVTINSLPDGSVRPTRHGMAKLKAMMGEAEHKDAGKEPHDAEPEKAEQAHQGDMPGMVMKKPGGGIRQNPKPMRMRLKDEHDIAAEQGHQVVHGVSMGKLEDATEDPIEVYIAASQWSFEPSELRLQAGVAYNFRMMGTDATHGASINLVRASHMIRVRAKALSEHAIIFTQSGEYLFYCTVYCGEGHDMMWGKINVE